MWDILCDNLNLQLQSHICKVAKDETHPHLPCALKGKGEGQSMVGLAPAFLS